MRTPIRIVSTSLFTLLFVVSAGIHAADATDVSGNVSGTWTTTGSPYIVTGNVTVQDATTLTIDPGVEVLFNQPGSTRYHFYIYGTLVADGTPTDHITFTSNKGTPDPGDWRSLNFSNPDTGCSLDYCDISYGGYGNQGSIYLYSAGTNVSITNTTLFESSTHGIYCSYNSSPAISGCTLSDNGSYGIYCDSTNCLPAVSGCTITNNGSYAIRMYGDGVEAITGSMTITGNSPNAIEVPGGNVDGRGDDTARWYDHTVPYVCTNSVTVSDAKTLTIDPGITVMFSGHYYFYIYGTLVADGTSSEHITFTSNKGTPAPSDWRCLNFSNPDSGCVLDYCDVSYGGYGNYGNIYLYSSWSNVSISNLNVTNGSSYGIYCSYNSSPSISSCTIDGNSSYGIYSDSQNCLPAVSDCTITDNGSYAIRMYANGVEAITGTMSITGNSPNAIEVPGSSIDGRGDDAALWLNHLVPYVFTSSVSVSDAKTLTLNPGITIKFSSYSLYFNIYGTLVAEGTAGQHITFTSNKGTPAPGDWRYLQFSNPDAGCSLDYCDLSYGGYGNQGSLYCYGAWNNVSITNSTVSNSSTYGVYCSYNSSPQITSCTIHDNTSYGLYCDSQNCTPAISNCTITDNGSYAIRMYATGVEAITGSMTITGNNPNAIEVPGGNVDGLGDDTATWQDYADYYYFSGSVSVNDAKTLTLSPGITIKFKHASSLNLTINGTLVADGTSLDHITFTSTKASPGPGDWRYLNFSNPESGCILDYCDFSYGGYSNNGMIRLYGAGTNVQITNSIVSQSAGHGIECNYYSHPAVTNTDILNSASYGLYCVSTSSPTLSNCAIQNSGSYGIYCSDGGSLPSVADSTITDNGSYAVRIYANGVEAIGGAMTISGNNPNAIEVPGGNIDGGADSTATWQNYVAYYYFSGSVSVNDAKNLTLSPGITIKFKHGSSLNFSINGTLVADGTPSDHITFTSAKASPAAGDWRYLQFSNPESGCILDYCDFSYGGYTNNGMVRLYGSGANVQITNSTVSQSAGYGIECNYYSHPTIMNADILNSATYGLYCVSSSSPTLSNCAIQNSGSYGIYCSDGGSLPSVADSTISDNGSYAIRMYANGIEGITGASTTISGNNPNAIEVPGGNVNGGADGTATWQDHADFYYVSGSVSVDNAKTLTLSPGITIKFKHASSLNFTINGTLVADGTSSEHITFTSAKASPGPGDWRYLRFSYPESGCILDYCDFSYGGYSSYGMISLYSTGTNVSISNSTASHSATYGILCDNNSSPVITGCTIDDNTSYGIYCTSQSCTPAISDCTITDNGNYSIRMYATGVEAITGTMSITGNTPNAIEIPGGNVNGLGDDTATWLYHQVPYIFTGSISVDNAKTLTLSPRITIKFKPASSLNFTINGTLVADGNPTQHITFTSDRGTPLPGDWRYLYLTSPESGCILDYCDFSYGGYTNYGMISLYNAGTNVSITNTTVSNGTTHGIQCYSNSRPTIANCTIQDNALYGIFCDSTSHSAVSNCIIEDNGSYAIGLYAEGVEAITGAMTITGNSPNAIQIQGGSINGLGDDFATWYNHEVPYVVTSSPSVNNNKTLTIEPGNTLKFNPSQNFGINGALVAEGTASDIITFTSNQGTPAPGDWRYLNFSSTDGPCSLKYCDILYGGYTNNGIINLSSTGTHVRRRK